MGTRSYFFFYLNLNWWTCSWRSQEGSKSVIPNAYTSMFFNPKMDFLLNPIPQSVWELSRTEGKEAPVFGSTTGTPLSAKLMEPQRGREWFEEKNEVREFRRSEEDTATKATVAPAATAAAANAEKGRRGGWGGWGLENEKGKRSDTIFVFRYFQYYVSESEPKQSPGTSSYLLVLVRWNIQLLPHA